MSLSGPGQRRRVMAVAMVSAFLTPFMSASVNVALPAVGAQLRAPVSVLGWVATGFLWAAAMALVPVGRAADLWGRRRVLSLGIQTYAVATLLAALSPAAPWLVASRLLQGVGSAMLFATGVAMLTEAFPASRRGKVLGWNVASTYLGLSLGPVLGGLLTESLGWRSIFSFTLPLAVVAWVLLRGLEREAPPQPPGTMDIPGGLTWGLSLACLLAGVSKLPGMPGFLLVATGLAGLAGFVGWERRAASPLLRVDLLWHNRAFALSSLAALVNYSATAGVGMLMSLYLQTVKGLSPRQAGLVLMVQPVLMTLASPVAGALSDRVQPRVLASAGMALTTVSLVSLTRLGLHSGLAYSVASLVLLGLGLGLFSSPNTNAIMGSVDRHTLGVASAMVGTMRLLGQMLSFGLATVVLKLWVGDEPLSMGSAPSLVASLRVCCGIFAALCSLGTLASWVRGQVARPEALPGAGGPPVA